MFPRRRREVVTEVECRHVHTHTHTHTHSSKKHNPGHTHSETYSQTHAAERDTDTTPKDTRPRYLLKITPNSPRMSL